MISDGSSCKAKDLLNKELKGYQNSNSTVIEINTAGVEDVYDFSEPRTNWGVVEGFIVHNCSEYLFINDSSCNLASINILKFYDIKNKKFDVDGYLHAIKFIQIAMDATIHWGSFPTPEIAENTWKFRANGLGVMNLGALLMVMGLPYDSEYARITASLLYSMMKAQSYLVSSLMAKKVAPFYEFNNNEKYMREVIKEHLNSINKIYKETSPEDIEKISKLFNNEFNNHYMFKYAISLWNAAIDQGNIYGYRNSQVTLCAPTGTIGFACDSATTGLEPFYSHIIYKKIVDGSYMKIVNPLIKDTLYNLGYASEIIDIIIKHINENGDIENCKYLNKNHIPIFDTAAKNGNGNRCISPMGHVKMVAALTPHMSGSSSKTVNCPNESTVEDIKNIYYQAWKLGCKCIALYRDGCKVVQPLTTKKEEFKNKDDVNNMNYYELLEFIKSLLNKEFSHSPLFSKSAFDICSPFNCLSLLLSI